MASAPAVSAPSRNQGLSLAGAMAVLWAIALGKFLFHLYFNNRYGYFRDEFDYIACGDHLAWGYVDQPPLIPFLSHLSRAVLGDSLRAIRFVPALASSFLVVQTGLLARELGGRFYAMLLAAVTVVIAGQYLSNGSLLGTNCLEPNLWMACAYFVMLAIQRGDPRYWLWVGVFAGIGLEEKYSIALFVFGIAVGLLMTRERRAFLNPWFWLGALAMFLIFLPNLLWNIHYHWPFFELIHNIRAEGRDVALGAGQYFFQQTLLMNPLTAPIWITGLIAFFRSSKLKPYRALGWSYLVCYAVLFLEHGKVYYLAPIYPMLLAAGAVVIDDFLSGSAAAVPLSPRSRPAYLKPALLILLLSGGAYLAPIVIPVFSPDRFLAYSRRLPFKLPVMEHAHSRQALPQWYSDQFGWNEIVRETAVAWNQLSLLERRDCAIFAQNYGQAGAIDFLGPQYGLPKSLSGHQTWFLWGPRGYSGSCMIVLDDRRERLEEFWTNVEYVGTSADNSYALEKDIPVFICRGPKFRSLADLWPALKRWG